MACDEMKRRRFDDGWKLEALKRGVWSGDVGLPERASPGMGRLQRSIVGIE